MLYRLLITTSDNVEIKDIVVNAPTFEALLQLVEDPGGKGYTLTEVLSALFSDTKLLGVEIDSKVELLGSDDTLLQWKYIN